MRRLGLPGLLLALAAAACGGGTTTTETAVVATQTVVETVTAQAPPTTSTLPSTLRSPTFQMPSRNIGCTYGEGVLVCDILSGLQPEPKKPCELDWTGMEMEALGPASPRCAGDTAYDQSAPVLAYGSRWEKGAFTCAAAETGLACRNGDGHGFALAREAWSRF